MKSILKLLFAILIASSSAFFIFIENAEVAEAVCPPGEFPHLQQDLKTTKCKNATLVNDNSDKQLGAVEKYIFTFVKVLSVVGTTLVALTITYSGYLYVTSDGNYMRTDMAKRLMIRSGIGVLVLACAFLIGNLLSVASGLGV